MAGVGFVLQRLAQVDRLSANFQGFAHAAFISSGPWLFTCLALAGVQQLAAPFVGRGALSGFSILTAYNFSFSLVISGPIVLVASRCFADAIYAKDVRHVSDILLVSLAWVFGLTAAFGVLLYGFGVARPPLECLAAFAGMLLASGIWVAAAFLAALKSYASVSVAFAAGAVTTLVAAGWLGSGTGSVGMLVSLTAGLAVIFFSLVALILADFPTDEPLTFSLIPALRRYWQLALIGLVYNAAIWVDKWIMWWAPQPVASTEGLLSNPAYEGAMFLAYLSSVPAVALALITVETRFYATYLRYFRGVREHASLSEIRRDHGELLQVMGSGLRQIALLQGSIGVLALLLAPKLVHAVGGGAEMVPIFRYGIVGAGFQVLLTMTLGALAYFDLRREVLVTAFVFLFLNAAMTAVSIQFGPQYHGYGYCLASATTFTFALYAAASRLGRLQYLTFVSNNPALRSPQAPQHRVAPPSQGRKGQSHE